MTANSHARATLSQHRGEAALDLPQQRRAQSLKRRASLQQVAREPRSDALRWLPTMALGLDLLAISIAVILAAVGHDLARTSSTSLRLDYVPGIEVAGPLVALAWLGAIALWGGYEAHVFGATADEFSRVLRASLMSGAVVGVGSYMLRFDLSRGWFFLTFAFGTLLVLLGRVGLRSWLKRARRHGYLTRRVVLVGDQAHIEAVAAVLERESWLGYEVVGGLAPPHEGAETPSGIKILGDACDVVGTSEAVKADVVFIAGGAFASPAGLREIAWELEHADTQLVVAPNLTDVSSERVRVRPVGGLPLIHLEKPRAAKAATWAKRGFDVAGASLVLVLSSPLLLFAALHVWAHDRGPVFFRQKRIGRDGEPFSCLKFRTMAVDAEERLSEVLAAQGLEHTAFAKLKVDPRITAPGHWLRRFSLDELPQLLNVVRGEMSLVGPRPQTALEVEHYDSATRRRLHVRPGMTGLWQVSGRSDLSLEESVRLDLYYTDNWSMMQDLAIMWRTLGAVVRSSGAY